MRRWADFNTDMSLLQREVGICIHAFKTDIIIFIINWRKE